MDVLSRFEEAHRNYLNAMQDAAVHNDVQQRAAEAYASYGRVLQETWTADLQKRATEAYDDYVRVLREAWASTDSQQRAAEAFTNYLRALQAAWAQVDVNALDSSSIALIGQSLMTVASIAAASTAGASNTLRTGAVSGPV